jgi:Flp pilus assembly protein TadG
MIKLTNWLNRPGWTFPLCPRRTLRPRSGQALVEFVFVAVMLLLMVFGLIDFCRAISTRQVITNLSREGANLVSRSTTITNAVASVIASANPLDINAHGRVIISVITNNSGAAIVADQLSRGGISTNSVASKIAPGGRGSTAAMPAITPLQLPQPTQTVYVVEVYYDYTPITPVGRFLGITLPPQLYDVAFF